ncbi:MAG: hypothetical protein J6B40_03870, partial [Oscillospiraceae bacterium]|nr:hypothetical protein [Oscillospiraceae bacterium]
SLLGLCGRLWPLSASASKEDGYVAPPLLTANMAAVVCGGGVDQTTLEQEALAGLAAARVLRCAHAKTTDPAAKLDGVNQWVTAHNGITEDAVAAALQGLYNSLGWDKTTGVPTAAALKGLHNAAELLAGIAEE